LGIVLVLVVVLVLGASTFCAGKDYRLSCNYFVPLVWLSNIRILEDEDDDEHEASFAPLRRARSALNYRLMGDASDFGRDAGFAESGRLLNFGV
jgi:hypothetical protein